MTRPNVLALKAETLEDFEITESGDNMFAICTALHARHSPPTTDATYLSQKQPSVTTGLSLSFGG